MSCDGGGTCHPFSFLFPSGGNILSGPSYGGNYSHTAGCGRSSSGMGIWTGTQSSFDVTEFSLESTCSFFGNASCSGLTIYPGMLAVTNCAGTPTEGWKLDDVEVLADFTTSCSGGRAPTRAVPDRNRDQHSKPDRMDDSHHLPCQLHRRGPRLDRSFP